MNEKPTQHSWVPNVLSDSGGKVCRNCGVVSECSEIACKRHPTFRGIPGFPADNEKAVPEIPEMDALDRLSFALHGRKAAPRDFIGGCNANILADAAERIDALKAEVARLSAPVSRQERMTSELACENYAVAAAEVRRLTALMCAHRCDEASGGDEVTPSVSSCLDELFNAPRGPDGEFPRFMEFYEEMCGNCKARLAAIEERREWRKKLGAAKRSVERIGKKVARATPPQDGGKE